MRQVTDEIAVIMAAGLGSRMRPLTDEIAKPLVKVNGKPLIESMIDGLRHRGVRRIYVVVGYKKEQFSYLVKKYENLSLVENKEYGTKNNIASLYCVCDVVAGQNAFICEADILVSDDAIFEFDLDKSCYYGKMVKGWSDDWVFDQDQTGRITRVGKGGKDCFNMVGIAYFLKNDATILSRAIGDAYRIIGNGHLFWDDVVDRNLDKIDLTVYEVNKDQVIEIDTVDELAKIDSSYANYMTREI